MNRVPIASWNPERDVWETGQMDLFSGHLDVFSGTWPASGMTRNGLAFELPTLGHRTSGTEYSSLPTPRATRGGSATEHLLPTPTATYSGNTAEDHLRKKPGRVSVTDLRILIEEVGL